MGTVLQTPEGLSRRSGGRRGFSIVELLVVVAILAVLLSILVPSLGRAKELARRAACASGLKAIGSAHHSYGTEWNRQLAWAPPTAHSGLGIWSVWHPSAGSYGAGLLVEKGFLGTGTVLYCPSWEHPYYMYNHPVYGWPADGDPTGQQWASCGYNYRATFEAPSYRSGNMDIDPADEPLTGDGFTNAAGPPGVDRHHLEGYNILYMDGKCVFRRDPDRVLADWVVEAGLGVVNWDMFEEFAWGRFFKYGSLDEPPE